MEEAARQSDRALIRSISELIIKRGMKSTTMDEVASYLGMSKRTLYEIFTSKKDMIMEVMKYWQGEHDTRIRRIFEDADNMMEAFHEVFRYHHDMLIIVNPSFFEDLDDYFPDARKEFERNGAERREGLMARINEGIEQGVFRPDVNYELSLRLVDVQMESLKRMEEHFSPQITLSEAFKAITTGFLRSVATPEGMKILDKLYRGND